MSPCFDERVRHFAEASQGGEGSPSVPSARKPFPVFGEAVVPCALNAPPDRGRRRLYLQDGLLLKISGYSDKIAILLKKTIGWMASFASELEAELARKPVG